MAGEKRDLVVSPGEYAFLRDGTKGTIKVFSGPTVVTPSAQDEGIVYDEKAGEFKPCADINQARKKHIVTVEGSYCVLLNPAKSRKQPDEGGQNNSAELDVGRKIVIPGPAMFALWPGQSASVIRGHQLRSNEYLIARVYNEDEAKKNWSKAVIKPAVLTTSQTPTDAATPDGTIVAPIAATPAVVAKASPVPFDLTVGKLLIIKGTEVSFYIPPTGISVVSEGLDENGKPQYVREALTLERLEYSILLGENGEKKYTNGPTVVFPDPTERFMEGRTDDGQLSRKFRAIELNELQGIHLKVIADFTDGGRSYKAGEEIFLTGKDTSIFYPREELSAIKYDGKIKSFATAIPVGEARYVLNRMTGEIRMVSGPAMLLPDPRTEVIVRRVLSNKQVSLWYPGNSEALAYNESLRQVLAQVPTTRGAPSEGDVARNYKGNKTLGASLSNAAITSGTVTSSFIADNSRVSKEQGYVGDEFARASSYAQPRSITLDSKYQGVPVVEVRTGYAVLVVDKNGGRRVVRGPSVVQVEYDESFEVLELSTGKPKTTDALLHTVYLRTDNNQVSDLVEVETADHIPVRLRLSYRVNFEGDSSKWWNVENYVKYLCDSIRSMLKGSVKKVRIEDFDANATEMVRDIVLGKPALDKPAGRIFEANGMRLTDVEVLGVDILNQDVKNALTASQLAVVKTNIELSQLRRGKEVTEQREAIVQEELAIRAETAKQKNNIDAEVAASNLTLMLEKLSNTMQQLEKQKEVDAVQNEMRDTGFTAELIRQKEAETQRLELQAVQQAQEIERLAADTSSVVSRFGAAQDGLADVIKGISDDKVAVDMAEAWAIQRVIGGDSIADALTKVFQGTSMMPLVRRITEGHGPLANGSTDKKPTVGA